MSVRYNTMNPVEPNGSSDFRDAHDNTGNLDLAMNGAALAWTDRLGRSKKSWAGIEDQVNAWLDSQGFEPGFLVYVDGSPLTVDRPTQLIQRDGNLYSVKRPASFPVELTGNWATDQNLLVAQVDRTLQDTLATSAGAGMIGYRERTVADRLNDTANVKDYGAIADGAYHPLSERFATLAEAQAVYPHATALTDSIDWAAAQAALNAGTPRVHFPGYRYVLNQDLSRTTSVILVGDGITSLEFTAGSRLTIEGSISALPALSANITPTSRSIAFVMPPNLAAGDVFLAFNPSDYSWSQHRNYYRAGEFFRAHSVSGSTVNIYGLPTDTYGVSDVQMHKVSGVRVSLEDITIKADPSTIGAPVVVRFGVGVTAKNFRGSGGSSYQIEFDRCYQVDFFGGAALNNSAYVDDEYGILISNCQRVTIVGGGHSATRHAIALGGGSGTGAVPCRDIFISDMRLDTSAADSPAADMHGNCDRVTYSNCSISHANMQGRDVKYIGCTIYQRTSAADGLVIYGSEIVGGTYEIIDCTLVTAGDLSSFGAINLSAIKTLKQAWSVIVRGLTVKGGAGGIGGGIVTISVAEGETLPTDVDIRGVRCELSAMRQVLFIRCNANTSQTVVSNGHIVDDVYGPANMYLIYPTGAALTGIPTRQMEQSGEVTVTTNGTGTALPAASISFRYRYSKKPMAVACASGVDGASFSTLGGQSPVPIVYAVAAASIRPGLIAATSSFTSGAQAVVGWRAGIKEI
ncbi:hypothetical protein L2D71_29785 [Pseudomonas aeruginosa]|uniref:phage tailspike polysaccharide lyase family protein n=1 Tax=Pseudomonas aeruginosa TaxID=287 RepID=UPI001F4201FD|nr:hypothetical protein [Pseudomonas aeruginosa]MCF3954867.1 hypothetical protein [Pseudomonas aeruginosa]